MGFYEWENQFIAQKHIKIGNNFKPLRELKTNIVSRRISNWNNRTVYIVTHPMANFIVVVPGDYIKTKHKKKLINEIKF